MIGKNNIMAMRNLNFVYKFTFSAKMSAKNVRSLLII